ncbi:MAG: hypothetical protein ACI9LO_000417 [Planctomycetota bacterium]|jgi:hypothetical protein
MAAILALVRQIKKGLAEFVELSLARAVFIAQNNRHACIEAL